MTKLEKIREALADVGRNYGQDTDKGSQKERQR